MKAAKVALTMFVTGGACLVVATYVTLGPTAALVVAGVLLMVSAPFIGLALD